MAMMPDGTIGDSRSRLRLVLQAHPAEFAEVELPPPSRAFTVARPVLLLPGGLRLTVDDTAPLDVAAKWWDALAVSSTYAALWYSTQRSGFPGGRHRQGGDQ